MRRRRQTLQVSTFPFLAVLLCTMGSLILVLLIIDCRGRAAALQRARQEAADKAEQAARQAEARREEKQRLLRAAWEEKRSSQHQRLLGEQDEVQAQMNALRRQMSEVAARLRYEQASEEELRQKTRARRGEVDQAERVLASSKAGAAGAADKAASSNRELARMTADLLRLQQVLTDLEAARLKAKQTYSVVPYRGRRGESRRPIYIECTAQGVTFHPDRVTVPVSLHSFLVGDVHPAGETPLDVHDEVVRRIGKQKEAMARSGQATNKQPYLLLLVRPDGIESYYRLQSALKDLDVKYGYELIDADWVLDFPPDDAAPTDQTWMHAARNPVAPPLPPSGNLPRARPRPQPAILTPNGDHPSSPGVMGATAPRGSGVAGGIAGAQGMPGPGVPGGTGWGATGSPTVPGSGGLAGPGTTTPGGPTGTGRPGAGRIVGLAPSWPGGNGDGMVGGGTPGSGPGLGRGFGPGGSGNGGPGSGGLPSGQTGSPTGSGVASLFPGAGGGSAGPGTGSWQPGGVPGAGGGSGGQGSLSGPGTPGGPGAPGASGLGTPIASSAGGSGAVVGTPGPAGVQGQPGGTSVAWTGQPGAAGGAFPGVPAGGAGVPGQAGSTGGPSGPAGATGTGAGGWQGTGQGVPGASGAAAGAGMGSPGAMAGATGSGGMPGQLGGASGQPGMGGGAVIPGGPGGDRASSAEGRQGAAPGTAAAWNGQPGGRGVPGGVARQPGDGSATQPPADGRQEAQPGDNAEPGDGPPAGASKSQNPGNAGRRRRPGPHGINWASNGAAGGDDDDDDDEEHPLDVVPGGPPQPRPKTRPRALRPARISGNRDWLIFVECRYDGLILYPSRQRFTQAELDQAPAVNPLLQALVKMIQRRQALVRPGEPLYRPQVRFLVRQDGVRCFHAANPLIEALGVPRTQQPLGWTDDVMAIISESH